MWLCLAAWLVAQQLGSSGNVSDGELPGWVGVAAGFEFVEVRSCPDGSKGLLGRREWKRREYRLWRADWNSSSGLVKSVSNGFGLRFVVGSNVDSGLKGQD